jgi:hypothetical protein
LGAVENPKLEDDLSKRREKEGLVTFGDQKCELCRLQSKILTFSFFFSRFSRENGIEVNYFLLCKNTFYLHLPQHNNSEGFLLDRRG